MSTITLRDHRSGLIIGPVEVSAPKILPVSGDSPGAFSTTWAKIRATVAPSPLGCGKLRTFQTGLADGRDVTDGPAPLSDRSFRIGRSIGKTITPTTREN